MGLFLISYTLVSSWGATESQIYGAYDSNECVNLESFVYCTAIICSCDMVCNGIS